MVHGGATVRFKSWMLGGIAHSHFQGQVTKELRKVTIPAVIVLLEQLALPAPGHAMLVATINTYHLTGVMA